MDTLSPTFVSGFELGRAQAAYMTMPTRWIVERIDVVGDISQRECSVLVDSFLDPFQPADVP